MARNKRRSPGEGSIYQRKDGLWVAQYKVETPSGKKTKYIYGKVRKEVAAKLARAIAEKDSGVFYDSENLTTGAYLDSWLDSIKDSLKERTVTRYEIVVRVHLKPTIGHVKLDKLNPLQVQDMYLAKLSSGLSAPSVKIIHAVQGSETSCSVVTDPQEHCRGSNPPHDQLRRK